jgi:hypothetical protein
MNLLMCKNSVAVSGNSAIPPLHGMMLRHLGPVTETRALFS